MCDKKEMCDLNCLECLHTDCINNNISEFEFILIEDEDKQIAYDEKIEKLHLLGKDKRFISQKRYMESDKGKLAIQKYEKKRLAIQWLERYERLYKGTSKNTNARRCKANSLRRLYGL